ncbi:MAG: hypothetical protein JWP01_2819 [Myxococcales bacterium]|nr:hypothetical protein [Myxococcales bacterium]
MIASELLKQRPSRRDLEVQQTARRRYPGDALVPRPRWGWTHALEVHATADRIWPFVAQIAADGSRFYGSQWLSAHPTIPPLRVATVVSGLHFVAYGGPDIIEPTTSWGAASWLFLIEPLGDNHSRVISRYRATTSDDLRTRLSSPELLNGPVARAMDWNVLRGVKARAEYHDRGDPNT